MRVVFADTFYFLALLNPSDSAHVRAVGFTRGYTGHMLTTAWVLTEVADAMARPGTRELAGRFIEDLPRQRAIQVAPASDALFRDGLELYRSRPDKEWPLTDCISFSAMTQAGIREAATGDRHFEQAGFVALLR